MRCDDDGEFITERVHAFPRGDAHKKEACNLGKLGLVLDPPV